MDRNPSAALIVALACAVSACVGETSAQAQSPEAQFTELASGQMVRGGASTSKQLRIITTPAEYADVFASYTNEARPTVDFTQGRVLLADMGSRSTGGYAIAVTSVDVAENRVRANIKLAVPGPDCIVTQAITNPYQFVFIPSVKEVLVSETLEVARC